MVAILLATPISARASSSPCDLNQDGTVNATDVGLAINMVVGSIPCVADIDGANVCNVAVVQRVVIASKGGECITGAGAIPHAVSLNWNASTSPLVAGYNVYRGTTSGGPYTKLSSSLISGTTFADKTVVAGKTYYYVCTAVDTTNNESVDSNQASATVPSP